MRLSTEFWVSAYLRQASADGDYAVLSRRGAAQGGQVFLVVDRLNGTCDLYGPAVQALVEDSADRLFECLLLQNDPLEIRERLSKEERFDPDLWVIERESPDGDHGLSLVKTEF
ncbi:MAG: DUF1491 family protein [Pseudomonadota bacterium]